MRDLPSYSELPRRAGFPASWDLWGDEFGCLNLLTPDRVVAAAGLVQRGAVFALNWSMGLPDPPLFGRESFRHEVTGADGSTSHDDVLHGWNTQSSSQWDGFRHIRNHAAADDEAGTGHFAGIDDADHGIHHWAQRGIVGRGVLADIGRWRERIGRPIRHAESDQIEPEEIADCLADQGTVLHVGDVLLVRTGWVGWYESQSTDVRAALAAPNGLTAPGFRSGEHLAEVLWNLHIAAIACDNPAVEAWPPDQSRRSDRRHLHDIFTHTLLLPMLGLPLGEMFDLEALSADCIADGRFEFMFTSAPLNLPHGVASPPNALAIK